MDLRGVITLTKEDRVSVRVLGDHHLVFVIKGPL